MRGHNVNIYFSEETYKKIKPLITQRKVSKFVNQAVEKELEKQQNQAKEQSTKQLITAYQRISKNKKMKSESELWDRISGDGLNNEYKNSR